MSRYKKIMLDKGIMQKDLLDSVRRIDKRVDKSLLSKVVNDVCLPNKSTLISICDTLSCDVLDIYDCREIDLQNLSQKNTATTELKAVATARIDRGGLSHGNNIYNLTVEIPRDVAERVFNKKALRKLGFLSKTDFVRQAVFELDRRLKKILDNEKAAQSADTLTDG